MKPKHSGVLRVYKAVGYSLKGIKAAFKSEAAIRQEFGALVIAIIVAVVGDFTVIEQFMLVASVLLLIIMELLNSAIEVVVDRIGSELHELSGRAKDIGSAAVFVTVILVILTWSVVLFA